MLKRPSWATCLVLLAFSWACGGTQTDDATVDPATRVSFQKEVLPMLQTHCTGCHGGGSFLPLGSYRELVQVREGVRTVVPGSPDASQIVQVIEEARMPKTVQGFHPRLKERMLSLLRLWVAQGAKDN